jgi:hypothetical protein
MIPPMATGQSKQQRLMWQDKCLRACTSPEARAALANEFERVRKKDARVGENNGKRKANAKRPVQRADILPAIQSAGIR